MNRRIGRMAGQAWDGYKNNLLVQDVVETAVMALGVAGAQALFSDMSPEEILLSGAVGAGVGMAGRPVGGYLGRRAGRLIDKQIPEISMELRGEVDNARGWVKQNMPQAAELLEAKAKHFYNEGAGYFEGTGAAFGRGRGDNIAQAGVGAIAPFLLNPQDRPEEVPA